MLMRQLMHEMGVPHLAARSKHMHCLDLIGQFEFGEDYAIVLLNGLRLHVRELDTILDCIRDEFKVAPTYDAVLTYPRLSAHWKSRSVIVRPKAELGTPWGRNIPKLCADLREWVTMYNLTGEWPEKELSRCVTPEAPSKHGGQTP